MTLAEWLRKNTAEERERVAKLLDTSVSMLYQYAGGHRLPSLSRMRKLELATKGEVPVASWSSEQPPQLRWPKETSR